MMLKQYVLIVILFLTINAVNSQNIDSVGVFNRLSAFGDNIINKLTFEDDNRVLVIYPAGGYSSRTGLEFGVMPVLTWQSGDSKVQRHGFENTLTASVQLSTNGMVDISCGLEYFFNNGFQLNFEVDRQKLNDKFWGTYSNLTYPHEISYSSNRIGGDVEITKKIFADFYAGIGAFFYDYSLTGNNINNNLLLGSSGGLVSGAGTILVFDTRNHLYYPSAGQYFKSRIDFFSPFGDYSFDRFSVDLRQYFGFKQNVLAFQFFMESVNGNTPFFMLPQLGGKNKLRGIGHSNRVIDKHVKYLQTELRMPLWWRFGAVAFIGCGDANQYLAVNFEDVLVSYGVGLRFRMLPHEPLNVRFDVGRTSTGLKGVFISLREAF